MSFAPRFGALAVARGGRALIPLRFASAVSFVLDDSFSSSAGGNIRRRNGYPPSPPIPDSTSRLVGPRLHLHTKIQSLIRSGNLDSAVAAVRRAASSPVRPTVFTCNAVAAAVLQGSPNAAVELFHFFHRQSGIVPNIVSYNAVIKAHCSSDRVDEAIKLYREILSTASFSPSAVTYRHLTKGLVDAGRLQEALDLLHEMLHKGHGSDSLVFNNVISGFLDVGNWEKAQELFEELQERCPVYDGAVHVSFMEAYWKEGKDKEAMDSYKSLLDQHFHMSPATCNVLLETLLRHSKHAEANKLWESMLDEHNPPSFHALNSESYNVMVNQCFQDGKFMEAIDVFHQHGLKPCQLDVGAFNNIIGKLCENGLLQEAQKLFEEMPKKAVLPDVYTYTYLVDACFKNGCADDALGYFKRAADPGKYGPKLNVAFFNMMLNGLMKVGGIADALAVYERMEAKEVKPNNMTFEVIIAKLCEEGNLDRAQEILQDMRHHGINPQPEFRLLVVEAFSKEGRGEAINLVFSPPSPQPALDISPLPSSSQGENCGTSPVSPIQEQQSNVGIQKLSGLPSTNISQGQELDHFSLECPQPQVVSVDTGALCDPYLVQTASIAPQAGLRGSTTCEEHAQVDHSPSKRVEKKQFAENSKFPSIVVYNRILEELLMVGQIEDALRVYEKILTTSVTPNATTYEILVKVLCEQLKLDEARVILQDMAKHGFVGTPKLWLLVTSTFSKAQRWEESARVPPLKSPVTQFRHVDNGKIQSLSSYASDYLGGNRHQPHQHQSENLTSQFRSYQGHSQYDHSRTAQHRVGAPTHVQLVNRNLQGSLQGANGFVNQAWNESSKSPPINSSPHLHAVPAYNRLFSALTKDGQVDKALANYRRMLEMQIKPNFMTYEILVVKLCEMEKLDAALELLQDMVSRQVIASDGLRLVVTRAFTKARRKEEIEKIFIPPRSICYRQCESHEVLSGPVNNASQDSLQMFGTHLSQTWNSSSLGQRVDCASRAEGCKHFEDITQDSPIVVYNNVFERLSNAGQLEDALIVYGAIRAMQIKPDAKSYEILVRKLCEQWKLDKAQELLQDMVNYEVAIPLELNSFVINTFGKAGRCEEIRRVISPQTPLLDPAQGQSISFSGSFSETMDQQCYSNFSAPRYLPSYSQLLTQAGNHRSQEGPSTFIASPGHQCDITNQWQHANPSQVSQHQFGVLGQSSYHPPDINTSQVPLCSPSRGLGNERWTGYSQGQPFHEFGYCQGQVSNWPSQVYPVTGEPQLTEPSCSTLEYQHRCSPPHWSQGSSSYQFTGSENYFYQGHCEQGHENKAPQQVFYGNCSHQSQPWESPQYGTQPLELSGFNSAQYPQQNWTTGRPCGATQLPPTEPDNRVFQPEQTAFSTYWNKPS